MSTARGIFLKTRQIVKGSNASVYIRVFFSRIIRILNNTPSSIDDSGEDDGEYNFFDHSLLLRSKKCVYFWQYKQTQKDSSEENDDVLCWSCCYQ